jgi:tetrahydromethanopterin S-methyltransferase subunit B
MYFFFFFHDQLQADVEELQKLSEQATRQKVKDILFIETRKLQTEITKLKEKEEKCASSLPPSKPSASSSATYTVTMTTYGAFERSISIPFHICCVAFSLGPVR